EPNKLLRWAYDTTKSTASAPEECKKYLKWEHSTSTMAALIIWHRVDCDDFMRIMIPLLYRGEYYQWRERFMNYLEKQTDGEAMINYIQNGDQSLPVITQVSLVGTTSNVPPPLKDKSMWTTEEKKNRKINRLSRSLLIQRLLNDIYSLIDNNNSTKELWDALERHMLESEYGDQDRKAAVLYDYETFKATEGEMLLDTYI
nr:hypothetical protein [Tanacetum cinerariifolium]